MKITYKGVTKDLKFYKGLKWNKPLTPEMKKFEKETGKNAIRGSKITGTFEYWMYWTSKQNKKKIQTIIINKKKYIMYSNIYDIHNNKHNINYGLVRKLKKFQKETNKNPIRNNKITGQYLDWYKKTYYPKNRIIEDKNIQYRNKLLKHIAIEDMEYEGISQDKIARILQNSYINHRKLEPTDIPEDIIIYNQKELKKKFRNYIILYKGIGTQLFKSKLMVEKHLNIITNGNSKNCISWTTNPDTAFDWCHDGYIIKAKIPIKNILLSYYGSYYLRETYEYEFIVISHKLPPNSYIIFKNNTNNNIEFNKFKKKCIQTKIN